VVKGVGVRVMNSVTLCDASRDSEEDFENVEDGRLLAEAVADTENVTEVEVVSENDDDCE
jgi:hypothetical protein